MDSFYRGLSPAEKANVGEYNFDHPNAFDADEIVKVRPLTPPPAHTGRERWELLS